MGEGGGWSSPTGEVGVVVSSEDCELGEGTESERLERLNPVLDFPLSAFSAPSPLVRTVELRGLSVLPDPGILDRRARKDRDESLVSDLLKEG